MQVAENLIDTPAANCLDDVAVNAGKEESHGTCAVEGRSGGFLDFKYQVWAAKHGSGLEGLGYHGWRYIFLPSYWRHDVG